MAQPPAYQPATDFSDEERDNVGGRATVRTAALDAELSAVALSVNAIRDNLFLLQRDDGQLRDGIVNLFNLAQEVLNLIVTQGNATPRGAWVTARVYALKDIVSQGSSTYLCALAHTSGVFATDLAAGKWLLIANASPLASTIPFVPTATIAATDVQGAINEADTEGRALSASLSAAAQAAAISSVLATLAANTGGGQIGFIDPSASTVATTVAAVLAQLKPVSMWGAWGNGTTQTTAIRAALANSLYVYFPPGVYNIDNDMPLRDDHVIVLSPGVQINQLTVNKSGFSATNKSRIKIFWNGAKYVGEGTWSAGWTGNGGHDDRGVNFYGCSDVLIANPHIEDCGHAAMAFIGGSRITVISPFLRGTNSRSTSLPYQANFQPGIYLKSDPVYGPVDHITVTDADIADVAIGVLDELEVGAVQRSGFLRVDGHVHDIPGQHAFYLTTRNVQIDATVSDLALSGVKIQAGDANQVIGNTKANLVARNLPNSQMFEIACPSPYTGKVVGLELEGVGVNVFRALSISRQVENVTADIVVETVFDAAVNVQGDAVKDLDVTIHARDVALDGITVSATNSTGLKFRPTIRNPNTSNSAGGCGISVASASAQVEVIDPDITDANGRMKYGLFNSIAGSDVKVRGQARFTGATDTAVRATGTISEWPQDATLSGTNGAFTDTANIKSDKPMVIRLATPLAAGNVVMWQRTMANNSTLHVKVILAVSKGSGIDRGSYEFEGTFYRQGGGIATLQGSVTTLHSQATGTLAVTFGLASNGANDVVLNVNPGGGILTKWAAIVTAIDAGP